MNTPSRHRSFTAAVRPTAGPCNHAARVLGALVLGYALLAAAPARAVPLLQLYVEGAVYDYDHESWVFDLDTGSTIRLWAIGNVAGPGSKGTIYDVKLSAVYRDIAPGMDATLSLTSGTTGGLGGFGDSSTPATPLFNQYDDSGALPQLSDGSTIAPHGTYGEGWEWQEFRLGDFTLTDSPIANFIDTFPTAPATPSGQINVYEIEIDSNITEIHFDLYDSIMARNGARAVFAPYSHDAGTGTNEPHHVPEPGTLLLGGLALAAAGRRLRRR